MKKKIEFDFDIWNELMKIKRVNPNLITVEKIKEFGMSDRRAYAYYFALNNLDSIANDAQLSKTVLRHMKEALKYKHLSKRQSQEIRELEDAVEILGSLNVYNIKSTNVKNVESIESDCTAVALLSDTHVEEIIEPKVVNNLNEYNPDIARERIKRYFSRLMFMIRSSRNTFDINTLVLAILGDMINGYIHEEYLEANDMSPTEAIMFVQELIIEGISYLHTYGDFKRIVIPMMRGNHGRTGQRKKYSTGYKNSFEWLMYHNIANYFNRAVGYENIEFLIPESEFAEVDLYGKKWLFSHGDHFNYRGGVGGIAIPFMGWMKRMLRVIPADKYAIAHWHTTMNLPMGAINGSVIGYSPYAMGKALEAEPPQQSLFIQDAKRGIVRTDPIILTDW